jgi:hypothetical protein
MPRWAVIAIDWAAPNVLAWWQDEEHAKDHAARMDGLALRAIAVPEGDSRIKDEEE